jgi:hypothetical protein
MPRTQDATREYPYGTYANFSAKKQVKGPGANGKSTERPVGYKITVEWVKFMFKKEYVSLVMEKKWHWVVMSNSREHADMAPKWIRTKISAAYPQGYDDKCLFLCVASGLHYTGLTEEATKLAALTSESMHLPGTRGMKALRTAMIDCAFSIGRPQVLNSPKKKQKNNMTVEDVASIVTEYPTVIIHVCTDGLVNHAICVVDNLIFDSTQ